MRLTVVEKAILAIIVMLIFFVGILTGMVLKP